MSLDFEIERTIIVTHKITLKVLLNSFSEKQENWKDVKMIERFPVKERIDMLRELLKEADLPTYRIITNGYNHLKRIETEDKSQVFTGKHVIGILMHHYKRNQTVSLG